MEVEQYGAGTSSGRHRIRIRGAHRNTHAYMDTFVPLCFFFLCIAVFCLPFAYLFAFSFVFVSSSPSWLSSLWACLYCSVYAWRWTLPAMPTGRPRQRRPNHPSIQPVPDPHFRPIPTPRFPLPFPILWPDVNVVGGNRLLQMPETLRAKQIVTYKLFSEQTKPSNHPMNDWQALATIVPSWPQSTPTATAKKPKSPRPRQRHALINGSIINYLPVQVHLQDLFRHHVIWAFVKFKRNSMSTLVNWGLNSNQSLGSNIT